jgi:hypothetical protein
MKKLTFGTFKQRHIRREISSNCCYDYEQFEGQLVITDGTFCMSFDDFWAKYDEGTLTEMFNNTKEIHEKFANTPPKIDWFVKEGQPIIWHENYTIAKDNTKFQPYERLICASSPIKDNVAN